MPCAAGAFGRRIVWSVALAAALALACPSPAQARPDAHLLEGARLLQAGKLEAALVEFEVAERLPGGAEARWYEAAVLARLGRTAEAVETFFVARERVPGAEDELLGYYFAVAAYDLGLYQLADALLANVIARAGPKVSAQARELRGRIATFLKEAPAREPVDAYIALGRAELGRARHHLAGAYFDEAAALIHLRGDGYRLDEAIALARQAREAGAPAREVSR